ncbi:SDR family oxidoreductase [Parenemella sanctibonifatiensis]|uniref:NAD(P)-dependent dehydrogenase n=1 Tax=Parenemella sanctibonifatiensis TaxID=2016505 RepID=A0A255EKX7_9ACTN|nr:SDR family oxidoreductase [Parenemella sanctibonifatiensis]OYN90265.1 NAD(P)-dependent dehydrogenase [Parenemella sanctibonifatiensis]
MNLEPEVTKRAEALVNSEGGFPAQQQEPPGLTSEMEPRPDHGEETWVGRGRLEGLRALITGGDSGIGRAVAIAYAREGADVALSYLPEEQSDAEDTASWIEKAGRVAVLLPGDIRDEQTCRTMVDQAAERLGGLDVLVNNAAFQMGRGEGLASISSEQLDRTFKTNLYAMFWATQQALPHLSKGASIINTSSVQSYDPSETLMDYAATKAAITNFTMSLAGELGPKGIRANAVAPGPIWTPLQPATQPEEKVEQFGGNTPLGRAGQPSELAGAYVFLASPAEASYVSGAVIGVTGGRPVF